MQPLETDKNVVNELKYKTWQSRGSWLRVSCTLFHKVLAKVAHVIFAYKNKMFNIAKWNYWNNVGKVVEQVLFILNDIWECKETRCLLLYNEILSW